MAGVDFVLVLFSDADADDWRDQHIINTGTLGCYLNEVLMMGS
jgi:hypothetical protein